LEPQTPIPQPIFTIFASTKNNTMKKSILIAVFLVTSSGFSQAFKGKGDTKFQVGPSFQDNGTGIAATIDFGVGANISFGFTTSYLLGVSDDFGKPKFDDRIDARARFNANIGNVLNVSDKFDLYPGLSIGLRNFGGHVGARYFFTEGFGIYTETGFPLAKYKTDAVENERLNNQFTFQIGAAFNL
jgi:outer membrane protein G